MRPVFEETRPLASVDDMRRQIRQKSKLKGRQADDSAIEQVQALIGKGPYRRDLLIEYLHALNDTYLGIKNVHMVAVAKLMRLPMAEVYEVASFYHHFDILRDGDTPSAITIRVCGGLSCNLKGAQDLLHKLPAMLGQTDARVVHVPCVGRCEQAPVAVVYQNPIVFATTDAVLQAVASQALEHPLANSPSDASFEPGDLAQQSVVTDNTTAGVSPDYVGFDAYCAGGGYALAASLEHASVASVEACIKAMEDSGLRGLGGAGFPAGRKWRIVRDQPAPKLMAVNIDEGEPGTFKDRTYLERDPHRFLEGMLVAAKVVGVSACYIYLRDEYHGARALLDIELAKLKANPPCALPLIELRRGAGAYICGEESAMIESIEGKRGEPRMRPPYIAEVGLFGRPTLEHNFETLYWVRDIVQRGSQWFSSFGLNGRTGLRSFSVSGRVKNPGVKLAPAGITVRQLINDYCGGMEEGHALYAYLPGGASGGILPERLADLPLDFDTLQAHGCFIGSAAVIVLGDQDRARDAASNMMAFFEHESCGQCTPCRVGTAKAATLMTAKVWDNNTLNDLNQVMVDASICGLGQAAPNPVRCVQQYFSQEVA
ncbi:NADH-quinone oxidoreductase subunit F [Betaproteobacteria bacterium MOLA814]|nr:NADH-quinone oxidoreductase subunit F [Betaproteobacteria bacterium MOLA814]